MKKLLVALLVTINGASFAQENAITTFILVRHAEKNLNQSAHDPDLSAVGKERAAKLAEMLKQTNIDAVYSTEFIRTRQTVEQLAQQRSLPVVSYQASVKEDIDLMLQKHKGRTVVICGHSNTSPHVINYLIGEDKYKNFADDEYGNIVIVSLTDRGKNAKVVWMSY
jgi:broad specificity phosphatase PhoE